MSRTSTSPTSSAALDDPVPADLSLALVVGQLSRPAEVRELPSGDTLVALELTSRRPDGVAESMPVIWADAPAWAGELAAGERVTVAGRVRRRFYRAGGV